MIYVNQGLTGFTYSNVTAKVDAFDVTKDYIVNDSARFGSRIYKSITGIAPNYNTGNYPLLSLNQDWFDYEPSNEHAMLDLFGETVTEWDGDGIIEFTRSGKDTIALGNFKASTITIEYLEDINGIVEGMTIATSVDLNSAVTAGYAYVNSTRVDLIETAKLFTASKDTYVDIDDTGTLIYTEVTNGDPAPTLTSPNERLAKVVTDGTAITSVEDLRTVIDPVLDTDTYNFIGYLYKKDFWTRLTAPFNTTAAKTVYQNLKRVGTTVRVTFSDGGYNTFCGFCVAGYATNAGATLDQVSFTDRTIGTKTASVASFKTIFDKSDLTSIMYAGKALKGVEMMFAVDPSTDSVFDNMVFLAKITKCDGVAEVATKNTITWELEQNIIT